MAPSTWTQRANARRRGRATPATCQSGEDGLRDLTPRMPRVSLDAHERLRCYAAGALRVCRGFAARAGAGRDADRLQRHVVQHRRGHRPRFSPRARRWSLLALLCGVAVLAACGEAVRPTTLRPAEPGHVVERVFHSGALRGPERYAVYLPAGYATSGLRYPVIYALHGLPSNETGYRHMGIADWGTGAEEAGRPVIVVAPQGARAGDTDPEWHDWGPGRNWETAVAHDLRREIDARFRTIPSRSGRALIGISAGGYGASIIGVRHPGLYSVIQSWSGYFRATNPAGDAPLELGSPEADSAASVHSYVRRARRVFRRDLPIAFGFFVGDEDPLFVPENVALHRELVAAKVPHRFAVYRGAHTGAFWEEHREEWIRDAVRALAPAG